MLFSLPPYRLWFQFEHFWEKIESLNDASLVASQFLTFAQRRAATVKIFVRLENVSCIRSLWKCTFRKRKSPTQYLVKEKTTKQIDWFDFLQTRRTVYKHIGAVPLRRDALPPTLSKLSEIGWPVEPASCLFFLLHIAIRSQSSWWPCVGADKALLLWIVFGFGTVFVSCLEWIRNA